MTAFAWVLSLFSLFFVSFFLCPVVSDGLETTALARWSLGVEASSIEGYTTHISSRTDVGKEGSRTGNGLPTDTLISLYGIHLQGRGRRRTDSLTACGLSLAPITCMLNNSCCGRRREKKNPWLWLGSSRYTRFMYDYWVTSIDIMSWGWGRRGSGYGNLTISHFFVRHCLISAL